MELWFSSRLGCLPGRREFKQGRFEFHIVDCNENINSILDNAIYHFDLHKSTACLFVFPDISSGYELTVEQVLIELGQKIEVLIGKSNQNEIKNKQISKSIVLNCPVTNQKIAYPDFDFIAFCPQACNELDKLYNPSLEAPYPCVNFTSDLFGFSHLVNDISHSLHGIAPFEIQIPEKREDLFLRSLKIWQGLAIKTMKTYASRTNSDLLCPIHISKSQNNWISTHADSAFASLDPSLYIQELPKSYCPRIIEKWRNWFDFGENIDLENVNISDELFLPAHSGKLNFIQSD
jgi:hypothetical protein